MAGKVVTFVIDTLEPKLDSALAAFINEIQKLGHELKQVRVADDTGETLVAPNTVEGVEPSAAPTPEPAPEEPPTDTPVDPTQPSDVSSETSSDAPSETATAS